MNNRLAFALTLALCALSFAATAQADAFLKLDGIPGESTGKGHKDEIAIDSFAFGASSSASATGSARSAGKAQFDALTFSHAVDRASPNLLLALARGQTIKTAVLTVQKPGSANEYMKITLTDVLVTSVKIGGGDKSATEEVTLSYGKIAYEYIPIQRDGSAGAAVKMGWDLGANKAM